MGRLTPGELVPGEIGAVVLAAGAATRFGAPKQAAPLWEQPLLEYALDIAAQSFVRRAVVLGANRQAILARVTLHGALPVVCSNWSDGLGASLRAGLRALGDVDAAVVLLGDQPLISAEAIRRVIAARSPEFAAVRATYAGRPGHPVLIERRAFAAVARLRPGETPQRALRELSTRRVACDDTGSSVDVDTPEELGCLEAGQQVSLSRSDGPIYVRGCPRTNSADPTDRSRNL